MKKGDILTAKKIVFLILSILLLVAVIIGIVMMINLFRDEVDINDRAQEIFADFTEKALKSPPEKLTSREQKLADNWSKVEGTCLSFMDGIVKKYANGEIDRKNAESALRAFLLYPLSGGQLTAYTSRVDSIAQGREKYESAQNTEDKTEKLLLLSYVSSEDSLYYPKAKEALASADATEELRSIITKYKIEYKISDAQALLGRLSGLWEKEDIDKLQADLKEYKEWQEDTTTYAGSIEVLYIRNLMAYPEITYSASCAYTDSFDSALITPSEFKKILEGLYERNYILIKAEDLVKDGKTASVEIPKGKRPVVLMIEDLTFPSSKSGNGTVDRIGFDEDGKLCTYTGTQISYDNESPLILDSFIYEHPDFTFRGARGCISLTGFDGVFGYRTQKGDNVDEAKKVADYLKDEGWTFACNSYGYADMSKKTLDQVKDDTEKWKDEVGSIVGDVSVYIWPYGSSVRKGEVHEYLFSQGFTLFCGVGSTPYRQNEPDGNGVFVDRKALSGYALQNRSDSFSDLFDADSVIDEIRESKQ